MRTMIFSDLITSKNAFLQLLAMTLFVAVFIAIGTGTLITSVACMATMVPFMYLFSIAAYDEQNGWERFRLTLPISRRQVAYGRYASTFIIVIASLAFAVIVGALMGIIVEALPEGMLDPGLRLSEWGMPALLAVGVLTQIVILLAAALSLPVIMRFGMTKGSRLVPVVILAALSFAAAFFGSNIESLDLGAMFADPGSVLGIALVVVTVVTLVLYCASAYLSGRLYESREL